MTWQSPLMSAGGDWRHTRFTTDDDYVLRYRLTSLSGGYIVALSREQLMNMARHGAAAMIAELRAQIAEIERAFPQVRAARRATVRAAGRVSGAFSSTAMRRARKGRRKMSAAQKRAVSARMKKYWAARRAAKAGKAK